VAKVRAKAFHLTAVTLTHVARERDDLEFA
jgi:hypothetical protein